MDSGLFGPQLATKNKSRQFEDIKYDTKRGRCKGVTGGVTGGVADGVAESVEMLAFGKKRLATCDLRPTAKCKMRPFSGKKLAFYRFSVCYKKGAQNTKLRPQPPLTPPPPKAVCFSYM